MNYTQKQIYKEAIQRLKIHMNGGLFRYSENLRDVRWFAHRVAEVYKPLGIFIDIGGALNPVNIILAEMGMHVHVVDFDVSKYQADARFGMLEKAGVNFIESDGLEYHFEEFDDETIDSVGSFHTFEHFHHSPRNLCEAAMQKLKPGGKLVIETPNAANLKKRIGLLFGKTNYLGYSGYYESEKYWLHIREYTVGDFEYLSQRLNFKEWKIFGLNYFGSFYPSHRSMLPLMPIDYAMRIRPGLCSSIFLAGIK